jgi:integrator complex subunit 11
VGRSCVLVKMGDKTVVFDCGIHMLYSDHQRYPDFNFILEGKNINQVIDLVIITHFHLDHCGALPFLTEHHKYSGPIYATTPTKAMIPYMLEDFRKVTTDAKKDEKQFYIYTQQEVLKSVTKINSIALQ